MEHPVCQTTKVPTVGLAYPVTAVLSLPFNLIESPHGNGIIESAEFLRWPNPERTRTV